MNCEFKLGRETVFYPRWRENNILRLKDTAWMNEWILFKCQSILAFQPPWALSSVRTRWYEFVSCFVSSRYARTGTFWRDPVNNALIRTAVNKAYFVMAVSTLYRTSYVPNEYILLLLGASLCKAKMQFEVIKELGNKLSYCMLSWVVFIEGNLKIIVY